MAKKWAVYVSDDAGWREGCPDYESVFFGSLPKGARYVSVRDGSDHGGHVAFDDQAEAEAFADGLRDSGDWTVKAPNHSHYGTETRPEYAVKTMRGG